MYSWRSIFNRSFWKSKKSLLLRSVWDFKNYFCCDIIRQLVDATAFWVACAMDHEKIRNKKPTLFLEQIDLCFELQSRRSRNLRGWLFKNYSGYISKLLTLKDTWWATLRKKLDTQSLPFSWAQNDQRRTVWPSGQLWFI